MTVQPPTTAHARVWAECHVCVGQAFERRVAVGSDSAAEGAGRVALAAANSDSRGQELHRALSCAEPCFFLEVSPSPYSVNLATLLSCVSFRWEDGRRRSCKSPRLSN